MLPAYATELVERATQQSGFPLHVEERGGIGYDSILKFGTRERSFHEVSYVPLYRGYRIHFIVNAARKILRFWEAPLEDRLVPAYERGRGLPQQDLRDLRQKVPENAPEHVLEELSTFLYEGLTRQLTSMPLDLRIERELHVLLPDHRPLQREYLERQRRDIEVLFHPGMAEVSPRRLYGASTAMNVVLADEVAEMTGLPSGSFLEASHYRSEGKRLGEILREVTEPGIRGDRIVTDRWAQELEMEDWYVWRKYDD